MVGTRVDSNQGYSQNINLESQDVPLPLKFIPWYGLVVGVKV